MNHNFYLVLLILLAAKHFTNEVRNIAYFEKGGIEAPGKVIFCCCSLCSHFLPFAYDSPTFVFLRLKYIILQNILNANGAAFMK